MSKKGQITLFVILGIILISVLAIGLYFRQQIAVKEASGEIPSLTSLPPDLESLRDEVASCANQVGNEAVFVIGQQGGYFAAPNDALNLGLFDIALGVKSNAKVLASEDNLKGEINSYIKELLPGCIDFNSYEGIEILQQPPETVVDFNDENVELTIDYRLTAQKDGNAYNLVEPYEVVLPLRVKKVYDTSSKVADDLISGKGELDATKMLSYGLDVDVYNFGEGINIVSVRDKKQDGDKNYEFVFGVSQ